MSFLALKRNLVPIFLALILTGCHHAVITHPPQLVGTWLSDSNPERDGYDLFKDGKGERRGAITREGNILWRCSDNTLQLNESGDFADYAYSIQGTHLILTKDGESRHFTNERDPAKLGLATADKLEEILTSVQATQKISKEDQTFVLMHAQRPYNAASSSSAYMVLRYEAGVGLYDRQKLLALLEQKCTNTASPREAAFYAEMYGVSISLPDGQMTRAVFELLSRLRTKDPKHVSQEEWDAYDQFLRDPTVHVRVHFGECAVGKRGLGAPDLTKLRQRIAAQMSSHPEPREKQFWEFVDRVVTQRNPVKP